MTEKIITIWLGQTATLNMSHFPDNFPNGAGIVHADDYPKFNPFRKKLPMMGNVSEDTIHWDYPIVNMRTGELTGNKLRVVCTGFYGYVNYELVANAPAMMNATRKLNMLKVAFDEIELKLAEFKERYGQNVQEEKTKELLKILEVAQQAKSKVYSVLDFKGYGGNK